MGKTEPKKHTERESERVREKRDEKKNRPFIVLRAMLYVYTRFDNNNSINEYKSLYCEQYPL